MVKYINSAALILLIIFLTGCNGEAAGPEESSTYSGITETGPESSKPIGKVDDDDWRMVPVSGNVLDDVLSDYPSMAFHPAYPNPTNGNKVNLSFSISRVSSISLYISDKPGNIMEYIFKKKQMSAGVYVYPYTFNKDLKHGIYRAFLEITSPSAEYKSYGDIQLSD